MIGHALLLTFCPAYRAKNKKLRAMCFRYIGRVPSLLTNKELADIIRHHLKYRRLRGARARAIARSIDRSMRASAVSTGNMRTTALRRQREDHETIPAYMFNPDPVGNWSHNDSSDSCRNTSHSSHSSHDSGSSWSGDSGGSDSGSSSCD